MSAAIWNLIASQIRSKQNLVLKEFSESSSPLSIVLQRSGLLSIVHCSSKLNERRSVPLSFVFCPLSFVNYPIISNFKPLKQLP